jgi:hypothetical protein
MNAAQVHALRICGPGNWEGNVPKRTAETLIRRGLLRRQFNRAVFLPSFRRQLVTTDAGRAALAKVGG